MPRFFFHVRDGQTIVDKEGTELPDLSAAKVSAVTLAGELLRWHAETFWNAGEWSLEVTDEKGLTLFTLYFQAVEAPVLRTREGLPPGHSKTAKPPERS